MSTPLKLMGILAHPDDESLGSGGILAKYAAEGVETYLVTATRGQRGWFGDPADYPGPTALGQIREQELHAAAELLGLREVTVLDYMDGELDQVEPAGVTGQIVSHLRRVRPQVVHTFDPFGIYGHPDHIAIGQFTTTAVAVAANPTYRDPEGRAPHQVSKLYYRVFTEEEGAAYQAAFGDLVMTIDGRERRTAPWPDWAITTRIDTLAYWAQVWQAVSCHQTQLPGYEALRRLPAEQQQQIWGRQSYYRALSLVNGGRAAEHDLFAGLREEQPAYRMSLPAMAMSSR